MKKLMIAAAIVCAAAFAQAGSVVWGNNYPINDYNSPGEEGALFNGAGYLILGSAADFFTAATAEGGSWDSALAAATQITSATITDGETLSNPTQGAINEDGRVVVDGYTGATTAFVTLTDGNGNFYLSKDITQTLPEKGAMNYLYDNDGSFYAESNPFKAADGYQGEGWYTAAAVPEPTSGLLLLLGVAGLALRRRRA